MNRNRSAAGSLRASRLLRSSLVLFPLLLASCSDQTVARLSASDAAEFSRSSDETSVFDVDPILINVPTYDGSGQAVHPDVVAFDTNWHGAKYWMTMTPYPKSDQTLENPSILTSADGENVAVPAGLTNPVIRPPKNSKNYNSDPELLYEPQTDRLVMFYRFVEKKSNTIRVSTSKDGVTWTEAPAPFWERSHRAVSPTVAPRSGAAARMWYVNAGKDGCDAASTTVNMRVGSDPTGKIVDTKWIGPVRTDLHIPGYVIWHIKARWVPEKAEYLMLISAFPEKGNGCKTDDLFLSHSTDGLHWETYPNPILKHQDRAWTAAAVYRSTFLYNGATDELDLWISARGTDGAWRLGHARAHYTSLLAALQSGQPLFKRSPSAFAAPMLQSGEQP